MTLALASGACSLEAVSLPLVQFLSELGYQGPLVLGACSLVGLCMFLLGNQGPRSLVGPFLSVLGNLGLFVLDACTLVGPCMFVHGVACSIAVHAICLLTCWPVFTLALSLACGMYA